MKLEQTLLTCRYPLRGNSKRMYSEIKHAVCIISGYLTVLVTEVELCKSEETGFFSVVTVLDGRSKFQIQTNHTSLKKIELVSFPDHASEIKQLLAYSVFSFSTPSRASNKEINIERCYVKGMFCFFLKGGSFLFNSSTIYSRNC